MNALTLFEIAARTLGLVPVMASSKILKTSSAGRLRIGGGREAISDSESERALVVVLTVYNVDIDMVEDNPRGRGETERTEYRQHHCFARN